MEKALKIGIVLLFVMVPCFSAQADANSELEALNELLGDDPRKRNPHLIDDRWEKVKEIAREEKEKKQKEKKRGSAKFGTAVPASQLGTYLEEQKTKDRWAQPSKDSETITSEAMIFPEQEREADNRPKLKERERGDLILPPIALPEEPKTETKTKGFWETVWDTVMGPKTTRKPRRRKYFGDPTGDGTWGSGSGSTSGFGGGGGGGGGMMFDQLDRLHEILSSPQVQVKVFTGLVAGVTLWQVLTQIFLKRTNVALALVPPQMIDEMLHQEVYYIPEHDDYGTAELRHFLEMSDSEKKTLLEEDPEFGVFLEEVLKSIDIQIFNKALEDGRAA